MTLGLLHTLSLLSSHYKAGVSDECANLGISLVVWWGLSVLPMGQPGRWHAFFSLPNLPLSMLCDCQHHKMIELVVALGTTYLGQVQARELRGIHLAACQKFRGRIHLRLLTNYTGSPKHCFSEPTVFPKL